MPLRWSALLVLAVPLLSRGGAYSIPDPVVSGVSPAVASPGQTITLTGTNLERVGYIAELQYTKKYTAAGESPTGIVDASSASATQLTFVAPSNVKPQSLALRYRRATKAQTVAAVTAPDTGFISRAPFAVPSRVSRPRRPRRSP